MTSLRVGRANLAEVAGETSGVVAVLAQPNGNTPLTDPPPVVVSMFCA